jgi:amidase
MLKIKRDNAVLTLSDKNVPVAHAASGDVVVFEVFDCFSNKIEHEDQTFSSVGWNNINPATGPLYVNNAKAGDVLKVQILDVQLANRGVTICVPGLGVFGYLWKHETTRIVPIFENAVHFSEKITLPVAPMIGVIGTAPANGEEIPTGTPGLHGGNMDCKKIGAGTTLYLPVNVDGALLAMGDMHAVMGDGEVVVSGIEVSGEITVRVTALKNSGLPLPLLVNDTHVITIFSAKKLEDAAKGATFHMQRFVTEQLGIEAREAAMLLSAAADLCICQVVDPLMTCRMELPLAIVKQYGYVFS